jgi:hypothetical protein
MELHFVFAGEATAPHGALQVFGKVKHHAIGSVTTGKHPLVCAVHVIVMPHDDGELFSLHFDSPVTGYRCGAFTPLGLLTGGPQNDGEQDTATKNGKQDVPHNFFDAVTAITLSICNGDQLVQFFAVSLGHGVESLQLRVVDVLNSNPLGLIVNSLHEKSL